MTIEDRNAKTVSVHDRNSDRQANNVLLDQLSNAVRPWFADFTNDDVRRAIEALRVPATCGRPPTPSHQHSASPSKTEPLPSDPRA